MKCELSYLALKVISCHWQLFMLLDLQRGFFVETTIFVLHVCVLFALNINLNSHKMFANKICKFEKATMVRHADH